MKIDRRNFLRGALSATVLPQCADGAVVDNETEASRTEFPVLLLELCGKYPGEEGPQAVAHLSARRMVMVDLEDGSQREVAAYSDGAGIGSAPVRPAGKMIVVCCGSGRNLRLGSVVKRTATRNGT